ncbi:hypothetical protein CASFOL_026746 [Castilleja foliolosa]|uniref:Uncharacterized protein n=1 Tax=Castilleja foliolosa TaxID=1961234 RepID=A0ABD3CJW3_9LAMI
MSSLPKILLTALNAAILIFAVYYIYFAVSLNQTSSTNPCLRHSVTSIQWVGVITLAAALVGIIGTWLKLKALESLYLWVMLITTFAAVVFCLFIWAVMPRLTAEETYYKTAEHGDWLTEYGPALQKVVANDKDLFAVKSCFNETRTCRTMANQTQDQKVPFVDVGCCIPPNRCGLEQTSSGLWATPKNGLNSTDDECLMWAKEGENCFDCDSCKAAYLANFQSQWEKEMTSHIISIIVLIVTSALAYYTFINNHYRGDNRDSKNGELGRTIV